ncbi:MAG: ketopantoate reductase family protein [Chloroflexota bacterium]
MMRFIVHGAGAIGSILGACLAKSGYKAVLIGREAHVNRINQSGLKIITKDGGFTVSLPAVTHPSELEYQYQPGDVIFLTTKSEDTGEAADCLIRYFPDYTPFFCLQNGVSNEELVSRKFRHVYGGVVFFSGTFLKAGEVAYTRPGRVGLGVYPTGINSAAKTVQEALQESGIPTSLHEHIMSVKWSKLVINLGMAVNAIIGLSGAEALASREPRELIADIAEEGLRVIQAAGNALEDEPGQPPAAERPARLRAMKDSPPDAAAEEMKHRPSAWQDLVLQRGKSEVDFLNGEIVRLGKKLGIPTPLNSLMVRVVKQMAEEKSAPGKYAVAELRKMLE